MSPALASGFLAPATPGKSLHFFFFTALLWCLALGLLPVRPQAVLFRRASFTGSQWRGTASSRSVLEIVGTDFGGPGAWSVLLVFGG